MLSVLYVQPSIGVIIHVCHVYVSISELNVFGTKKSHQKSKQDTSCALLKYVNMCITEIPYPKP